MRQNTVYKIMYHKKALICEQGFVAYSTNWEN